HRGRSGVMVDIPVDGLVRADGSPATGNIQMALTPVDVSDAEEVRSFPGRFEGLLPDGEDALLLSLGTAEYAFEQEGEPLQLAPGKTAEVEIPIYTDGAIVGDQIPLWSMNETTGAWVHEGLGTVRESTSSPSGLVLAGRVSHFSWWNCDHFDEDPDDAEGLCYKWECFNGLCNKVKVFCWVEGAIHGDLDKRAALSPPVFSARKFFPQEGGNVILPGGRTVTLRGTSLQGNVLLRSDTTFVAVPGGSSSFELTLDTAVVYDVNKFTLPVDTMATMETSTDVHIYEMDAVAGQVFGYSARRVSGGSFSGTMIVRSEDGTEIATNSMNNQIRLVRIPEDGTYSFVATAASASNSTYRFIVQPVYGSVPVNSNTEVAIPDGQFRLFQFEVQQEQTLNLGVYADGGLIRSDLIAYNTALQSIATHAIAPDTEPFEVVPGTHYIVVRPRQNLTDPVRFGLSVVTPDSPTLLTFNSAGMADISTALNYHGQYRYYEFDATEGDGFELGVFRPDGVGVENMHFRLVAPDVGQLPSIIPHQGWDDRIVTGWSMQLP
ncbi:MAG: hypothetical protein KDD65_05010, partial [Bacteroidetes bacterium]|nr:hypothetical protein [Bacteroidota bacterium]